MAARRGNIAADRDVMGWEVAMRFVLPPFVVCALVLVGARSGIASCGDQPGDDAAVATTRADAASQCDCATATSRAAYVGCVNGVAKDAIAAGRLRARCRGAVVRCAVRSTCGRQAAVTCCRTSEDGFFRGCTIRPSAADCTAPAGGTACMSGQPSCCDACANGGCAPSTTTTAPTSTATTSTAPTGACRPCAGDTDCNDGNACSQDRCVGGTCEHQCLCVGPTGGAACCPGPATECGPTWFHTCGDPVCGEHRDQGVPPCTCGEEAGVSCSPEGGRCDPGDACNRLLVCATSDPTHGGMCPISRRRYKEDIRYLGAADLRRLRDELMRFPLATYRYKDPASPTHLGFVIEDVEPSPSVDATHDMVDLYGYTSMAVAALQAQEREIAALRREVKALRRALGRRQQPRAEAAPAG